MIEIYPVFTDTLNQKTNTTIVPRQINKMKQFYEFEDYFFLKNFPFFEDFSNVFQRILFCVYKGFCTFICPSRPHRIAISLLLNLWRIISNQTLYKYDLYFVT